MTKDQRSILRQAFSLLRIGADQGMDLTKTGSLYVVRRHVAEMEEMVGIMKRTLDEAAGAGAILEKVRGAATETEETLFARVSRRRGIGG